MSAHDEGLPPILDPPPLMDLGADLAGEEGAEDQGADASQDDPNAAIVERFGGDPAQMAAALARMETELQNRDQQFQAMNERLVGLLEQRGQTNGDGNADPTQDFIEQIRQAGEQGEDIVTPLVTGLLERVQGQIDEALQSRLGEFQQQQTVQQRIMARQDELQPVMKEAKEILAEVPGLIPTDKGPEALEKGVDYLIQLARAKAGNQAAPKRQPTRMDPGRSNRNMGANRQTSNRREDVKAAIQKMSETQHDADRHEAMMKLLGFK